MNNEGVATDVGALESLLAGGGGGEDIEAASDGLAVDLKNIDRDAWFDTGRIGPRLVQHSNDIECSCYRCACPVLDPACPALQYTRWLYGGTKAQDILYERLRSLLLERSSAYATFPRCFRLSLCFGFCALLSRCSPTAGISRQNGGSTMGRVVGTRSAVSQPAHFGGESVRLDR